MKKLFLLTVCILLLTGCGAAKDNPAANDEVNNTAATAENQPDESALLEQIPDFPVKVLGLNSYEFDSKILDLYMTNPEVTEFTKDAITATGVLCNEWHATEKIVTVKYTIVDGSVDAAELIPDEGLVLTPAIPFSTDMLYEFVDYIFYEVNGESIETEFTKENFPSIELIDEWSYNYRYDGNIIVTDASGQKWSTRSDLRLLGLIYKNRGNENFENWNWNTSHDRTSYFFVPVE